MRCWLWTDASIFNESLAQLSTLVNSIFKEFQKTWNLCSDVVTDSFFGPSLLVLKEGCLHFATYMASIMIIIFGVWIKYQPGLLTQKGARHSQVDFLAISQGQELINISGSWHSFQLLFEKLFQLETVLLLRT